MFKSCVGVLYPFRSMSVKSLNCTATPAAVLNLKRATGRPPPPNWMILCSEKSKEIQYLGQTQVFSDARLAILFPNKKQEYQTVYSKNRLWRNTLLFTWRSAPIGLAGLAESKNQWLASLVLEKYFSHCLVSFSLSTRIGEMRWYPHSLINWVKCCSTAGVATAS